MEFFFIDEEQYIDQKKRVYREYTKKVLKANKKRLEKGKEHTNQPKKTNILGIAIRSIQKQPNKRNIHVWDTTNPSKKGKDNREFQSQS